MFCCKKRKARKAAKAQAIVSSLAAVESALEGKTAEMFAEKLTGNKKALNKARKATARPFVPLRRNWLVLSVTAASAPRKGLAFLGLLVALGVAGAAAYNAARPVEDPGRTHKRYIPRFSSLHVLRRR